MDQSKYIQHIADQKANARKNRASLPIQEKLQKMVELQKIVAVTRAKRGEFVRVWKLE